MGEVLSVSAGVEWTRAVLRQWGVWARGHLRMTLALSTLAFVIGWVMNTYLMAFVLEGSTVDPDIETAATADEHTANGLFWLLLFAFVAGLITYAWSRGWRDFRTDLTALPRLFVEAMTRGRTGALAMVLWGAAVSLVISTLISSAVSLALGLVLFALAATPVGIILNFALIRVWRGLCGVIAPVAGPQVAAMVSPFMAMLGEALGLFLDWMIGVWTISLLLGVASAVMSLLLVRGTPRPGPAAVVIVGFAVVLCELVRVRSAYADDGGWSECFTSTGEPCTGPRGIFAWAGSDGAGYVMARAAVGGVFSSAGAAIGAGIGGAAAALAGATSGNAGSSTGVGGLPAQGASGGPSPAPSPGRANGSPRSGLDGPISDNAKRPAATHSVPDEAASDRGGPVGAAPSQTVGPPSDTNHLSSNADGVSVQENPAGVSPSGDADEGDLPAQISGDDAWGQASTSSVRANVDSRVVDPSSDSASERPRGHGPNFDVGDILPEDPDRETGETGDEDEGEASTREPPHPPDRE